MKLYFYMAISSFYKFCLNMKKRTSWFCLHKTFIQENASNAYYITGIIVVKGRFPIL